MNTDTRYQEIDAVTCLSALFTKCEKTQGTMEPTWQVIGERERCTLPQARGRESRESVELAFIGHLAHACMGLHSYTMRAHGLHDYAVCRLCDHAVHGIHRT